MIISQQQLKLPGVETWDKTGEQKLKSIDMLL